MASAQQVWDFSHAFLNDEDGWCVTMMLRIFMDETGVHDDADMVAVAAYVGGPKTWRAWTKDWNIHKRRVPAGRKPIKVFHSTDCAACRGEFDGWDKKTEQFPYVAQLLPVIPAHNIAGFVIGLQLKDYNKAMAGHPELKEMLGRPYAACFQWAITEILNIATQYGRNPMRLAFVHEVNDYKGDAMAAFEYVKTYQNPRNLKMTMAFGSKEDYPPLQAADVLAFEGGKFLKNPMQNTHRRAWVALDPDKTRITAKRYAKDNMAELISLSKGFRDRLIAQGWDGKLIA